VKLTTRLHLVPRSSMRGAIPPLSQYVLMVWCLVKHKDNFTFLPLINAEKSTNHDVSRLTISSSSNDSIYVYLYLVQLNGQ
jgi:hypothetical protein